MAKKTRTNPNEKRRTPPSGDPAPQSKRVTKKPGGSAPAKKVVKKKVKKKKPKRPTRKKLPKPAKFDKQRVGQNEYVDLDKNRKLTKAQRESLKRFRGPSGRSARDELFASAMEKVREKHGNERMITSSDLGSLTISIPINCLALEWLFGMNGYPVGQMVQYCGPPGSLKSSLMYETYRMFLAADGGAVHAENETKMSDDLYKSILEIDDIYDHRGPEIGFSESVEDAQRLIMFSTKELTKRMEGTKNEPGPGASIPVCFGIDSLTGKLCEESQKKIMEDGFAGRGHPVEALSWTRWLKTYSNYFQDWPFTLLVINHLKESKDGKGFTVRNRGGGHQVTFQEGTEIEVKISKKQVKCAEYSGVEISLKCFKNSFGETYRTSKTRMLFYREEDPTTGEISQTTWFDWGWAFVNLIREMNDSRVKQNIKDMGLHLGITSDTLIEHKCWSKDLGMKKEDADSWSVVGAKIQENEELMWRWRKALGLKRVPYLDGDYREQQERLMKEAANSE